MFNYSKLRGLIVEKFGNASAFAKELGITEQSLSSKLNSKTPFKQAEIIKSSELLGIDPSDISVYFFTLNVQY